jgi:hypothetical protein
MEKKLFQFILHCIAKISLDSTTFWNGIFVAFFLLVDIQQVRISCTQDHIFFDSARIFLVNVSETVFDINTNYFFSGRIGSEVGDVVLSLFPLRPS